MSAAPASPHLAKAVEELHSTLLLGDVGELNKLLTKTAAHQASPSQLVNTVDENGFAALHRVVRTPEQLPLLQALLKVPGVVVDVIGEDKETPLFMAVHNNNIPAATALVQAGAKVNILCGVSAQRVETPLHSAVKFGYDEMCAFLIHHKAEINARDGMRATPLIVAAASNRPSLVYQLLANGANAAVQDADGRDAMYAASERRNVHCVTLLKVDRKHLNDAMSQVRTDMKLEKPPMHTTEQLLQMAEERKKSEAEQEKALQALQAQQEAKSTPASPAAVASPAAAAAVAPSVTSGGAQQKENKIPAPPQSKSAAASSAASKKPAAPPKEIGAAAAAAAEAASRSAPAPPPPFVAYESRQQQLSPAGAGAASQSQRVEPMATRTHDPLTGKKLPPCKTLEEVGPETPPQVPRHLIRDIPAQEVLGTRMVVGTGVPDMERPRAPSMMFINAFNTEESAYR